MCKLLQQLLQWLLWWNEETGTLRLLVNTISEEKKQSGEDEGEKHLKWDLPHLSKSGPDAFHEDVGIIQRVLFAGQLGITSRYDLCQVGQQTKYVEISQRLHRRRQDPIWTNKI